jgi:hypothetical protein
MRKTFCLAAEKFALEWSLVLGSFGDSNPDLVSQLALHAPKTST